MNVISEAAVSAEVISFPELPSGWRHLRSAARNVAEAAFETAAAYDVDGAYPTADVIALHQCGLLAAPLPHEFGGVALSGPALNETLQRIGWGSLPLGRLFEGHVNALQLVLRYGDREQVALVARETLEGKLFGVWNTDDANGLRLIHKKGRSVLDGQKILASGAGHVERPIVTAADDQGHRLMVMPAVTTVARADLSRWTALGMRASATGSVDFSGLAVEPLEILGQNGDYERQPFFSGGAWRFAAVHLGGMQRLFELHHEHLRRTGRGQDAHQAARLGEAAIAIETANLGLSARPRSPKPRRTRERPIRLSLM